MMEHWAVQYIGLPWSESGYGSDECPAYNCWTFFRMVQEKHYGRNVGDLPFEVGKAVELSKGFKELDILGMGFKPTPDPKDGDGVIMMRSTSLPHVGIFIKPPTFPMVLHCQQGLGVTANLFSTHFRALWSEFRFYTWVGK